MSNLLQPRGPLPTRVYWVRRLLVAALAVALATVAGITVSAFGDGGGPDTESTPPGQAPSSTTPTTAGGLGPSNRPTAAQTSADSDGTASSEDGQQAQGDQDRPGADAPPSKGDRDQDVGGAPSPEPEETTTPLPEPTGQCDPAQVELSIEVEDSRAGRPNSAQLQFTSTSLAACTLGITPETLEVQITSGDDLIWSSTDCPARLAARQVVARSDPPATYVFTWSGHRSTQSCGGRGDVAGAGGYYLSAALIGGEPASAYFDVT